MSLDPEHARILQDASSDEAQDIAARAALHELVAGFWSLDQAMERCQEQIADRERSEAMVNDTPDYQIAALRLLAEAAASLAWGAAALIEMRNHYAAAALTRQIVELEYLAWAFNNDIEEVKDWYTSTKQERLEQWTPRKLLKKAGVTFRGQDYGSHCENGGHPTPQGIAHLMFGDPTVADAFGRYEILTHGYSAWNYAITAVDALCERFGVDTVLALPDALPTTDAAWDHYSETEKLSKLSKREQSDPRN